MEAHLTISDLAEQLDIPIPTLRGWCIALEESGYHEVARNNRDDRIFDAEDVEIFTYMKELKDKHGRKAGTKDLINFIADQDRFKSKLKRVLSDPLPIQPKGMLTSIDINEIMANERFKELVMDFVYKATEGMDKQISNQVSVNVSKQLEAALKESAAAKEEVLHMQEKLDKLENDRMKQTDSLITEMRRTQKMIQEQQNMSFFQRLFGKKKGTD
jgi:DNA-binding transcriptional MerR regulator